MERILNFRFESFVGRVGFIIGAFLICAALVGLVVAFASGRLPRAGLIALICALVAGGLLFGPAAPRVAKAFWRLAAHPEPPNPTGPLPVGAANVILQPAPGTGSAIIAQIWFPARTEELQPPPTTPTSSAPIDCTALGQLRLADPRPRSRFMILLYAPSVSGSRDENALTAASLSSHGYVVVAIDDIDRGQPPGTAMLPAFDFSSDAAYAETLRRGADKAVLEARQALSALDRLQACISDEWRDKVEFDRVGFFGFSYGGAVAAMAGILDARVAAAANIDGFVFGPALSGSIEKPYLFLVDGEPAPSSQSLGSSDVSKRLNAKLAQQFLTEHGRLAELPHKYGFRFRNVVHRSFSDWAFSPEAFTTWLYADPACVKTIKDAYLLAFFDTYLRNAPQPLLTQSPSPYRGIDVLKGRPHWFDRE